MLKIVLFIILVQSLLKIFNNKQLANGPMNILALLPPANTTNEELFMSNSRILFHTGPPSLDRDNTSTFSMFSYIQLSKPTRWVVGGPHSLGLRVLTLEKATSRCLTRRYPKVYFNRRDQNDKKDLLLKIAICSISSCNSCALIG